MTLFGIAPPHSQTLGTITFPTSGAAAAQPAFLEGVKYLHSFQFEEAAEAFKRVQKADLGLAMAYWGEAMSHNHPLWAQLDIPASKAALEKLAPTHEQAMAKMHAQWPDDHEIATFYALSLLGTASLHTDRADRVSQWLVISCCSRVLAGVRASFADG